MDVAFGRKSPGVLKSRLSGLFAECGVGVGCNWRIIEEEDYVAEEVVDGCEEGVIEFYGNGCTDFCSEADAEDPKLGKVAVGISADFVLIVVEKVLGLMVVCFTEAAVPGIIGEGVVGGGCLNGEEAIESVVGVIGIFSLDEGSVGIVDEVVDLMEMVVGVGCLIFRKAVSMGVVGVGVLRFFDELIEWIVGVVMGRFVGESLEDGTCWAVGSDLLIEVGAKGRSGTEEEIIG